GIIREALLVLHAIARHRSCPENLRDFRMMILNRQLSVDGKQEAGYCIAIFNSSSLMTKTTVAGINRV
ncbi:MAG: hypothetical protein WB611_26455, partial [Stellaceae bacterium]